MHTRNEVFILGDPERAADRVYQLADELERWPERLPHYRYLQVTQRTNRHRVADFGAVRPFSGNPASGWPVKWRARQELFPKERRITFRHVGGVTRGMWVEWRITPEHGGVRVAIAHELTYPVPLLGPLFAEWVVGRLFVSHIAGRTLACFKAQIEAELQENGKGRETVAVAREGAR